MCGGGNNAKSGSDRSIDWTCSSAANPPLPSPSLLPSRLQLACTCSRLASWRREGGVCKANQMKIVLEGQTSAMEDRRSPRLRHHGLDYRVSVLADSSRSERSATRFVSSRIPYSAIQNYRCQPLFKLIYIEMWRWRVSAACPSSGRCAVVAAPAGGRKTFHFDFEGSKFNLRISEPAHPSVPRNHGVPFSKATLRPPQRVEAGDGVHGEASESEEEGSGGERSAQRRSRGENHYNDEIRE